MILISFFSDFSSEDPFYSKFKSHAVEIEIVYAVGMAVALLSNIWVRLFLEEWKIVTRKDRTHALGERAWHLTTKLTFITFMSIYENQCKKI